MHEVFSSYPLASLQKEVWIKQTLHAELPFYNIGGYIVINRAIDRILFEQALNILINHYDSLRIRLKPTDTIPEQLFAEIVLFKLDFKDYSDYIEPDLKAKEWMRHVFAQPMALYNEPLFDFSLIKLSEQRYYFLLKFHHLIADGWSISLLSQSVAHIYNSLVNQKLPLLTSYPYTNYLLEEVAEDNKKLQAAKAYWLAKYQQLPEPIFSAKRTSTVNASPAPSRTLTLELSNSLQQQLLSLANTHQVSVFHVILGILLVYLAKTTGQRDLVIGLPLLNRKTAAHKQTVGLFANIIPARFELAMQHTFVDTLHTIAQVLRQDYRHQRLPISHLYQALGLSQRQTLFDVMLSYEKHDYDLAFNGVPAQAHGLSHGFNQNALELYVREYHQGAQVAWDFEYNTAVFSEAEAQLLVQRFQRLIHSVLEQPNTPLRQLSIEPKVLSTLSAPSIKLTQAFTPIPESAKTLTTYFALQAERYADNIAVKTRDQCWTYRELDQKANQVAQALVAYPKVERVALLFEQGADMLAALWGVLKAGKAYIPLPTAFPLERLQYVAQDAQVGAALTNAQNALLLDQVLEQSTLPIIRIDQLTTSTEPVSVTVQPDALAYILYTSGSTGQPKGVMQTQRNVLHFIRCYTEVLHIAAQDKLTLIAPYNFDAAVMDIFGALLNGAMLYPIDLKSDNLIELSKWLQQEQLTIYHSTPTIYRYWMQSLAPDILLNSLRLVVLGGETAYQTDLDYYHQHCTKDCLLLNGLGSTESSFHLMQVFGHESVSDQAELSVGYPLRETKVLLLDESGDDNGVYGEIAIESDYITLGYWQRPELNQNSFTSSQTGKRVYRSGDLGRLLADGSLLCLGRKDFQIKHRGFRIDLTEIEQVLKQSIAIKDAAVLSQQQANYESVLTGYVVSSTNSLVDSEQLKSWLRTKLPDYMIPTFIVALTALPLTANGKVDRQALKKLPIPTATQQDASSPESWEEQVLSAIWSEVLHIPTTQRHANFFDLGGHSLNATQVLSRLHQATGLKLELVDIFQHPTLAELAQIAKTKQAHYYPVLPNSTLATDYPLTHAQQRMWVMQQMVHSATAYNMYVAYQLKGAIDQDALASALHQLVQRHEILRTVFQLREGKPRQVILPQPAAELFTVRTVTTALTSYLTKQAEQVLDLEYMPPFRVELLMLNREEAILFFNIHHIITDGWSVNLIFKELKALYAGQTLTYKPYQYRNYTLWQHELLQSTALASAKHYWLNQLAGEIPVLDLPLDYGRPPQQAFTGARVDFTLDKPKVIALAQRASATPFMVLLTLLNILLYRYTEQDDILIGTPIAGRPLPELENELGFYANTLVLRNTLHSEHSFQATLEQIKHNTLAAYQHQHYPFDQLVDELQLKRDLSRSPLFDVMLVLQNQGNSSLALEGIECQKYELPMTHSRFDLTLFVTESGDQFNAQWEYNTQLFKPARIERMVSHLETLLDSAYQQPDTAIQALTLLPAAERQLLLYDFNQTDKPYPADVTIVDLFDAMVARVPEQSSLIYKGQVTSYRELNTKVEQLAQALQYTYSLQADDCVGIMLERSDWMVISILAILKAGAAYIPIPPEYPQERREYIVADSGCKVLLTETVIEQLLASSNDAHISGFTQCKIEPSQLAYVLYTSGSTGKPKGCQIEHRHFYNYIQWGLEYYFDGSVQGHFGLFTPLAFDFTLTSIFCSLLRGQTLTIYPQDQEIDSVLLHNFDPSNAIDIIKLTPAHISMLKHLKITQTNIRKVIVGGEELTTEQVSILKTINPHMTIINEYGPTETTVGCIVKSVELNEKVLIGKPITNTYCYILDKAGQPAPLGVKGEICIGGAGVGRGYFNRPDLTASKFIPSPFLSHDRLYRTGDVGRWLDNGEVECFGRLDAQIKIRGYRIECGEIEQKLVQHPDILETVVVVRGEGADKALAAYLRSSNPHLTPQEVRHYLKAQLPDYMVPTWLILLDQFPLTPNGKINRQALPQPDTLPTRTDVISARNELEQHLLTIWQQTLGRSALSIEDNFFELGGDSIKAIQVMAALHQLKLKCELRHIFQYPTIAELAPYLKPLTAVIDQQALSGEVSLTPIQQWFFNSFTGKYSHYNHSVLLSAKQRFEQPALQQALQHLVDHHDMLRATYSVQADGIIQTIQAQANLILEVITLSGDASESSLHPYIQAAQASFNLEQAPLVKVLLFRTDEGDKLLLIVHHLVIDGVSWRILLADLAQGYQQALQGQTLKLPAKTYSYRYWAQALYQRVQEPVFKREAAYWHEVLSQSVAPLPLTNLAGSRRHQDSQTLRQQFSLETTQQLLTQAPQAYNLTINDLLLTILGRTLQQWTGQAKHYIDLESHGRDFNADLDVSRTLGWFTAIYPVLLDLSQTSELGEQLPQIKEMLRRVPHKGISYGLLKYLSNTVLPASPAQIVFNYLGQFDTDLQNEVFELASTELPYNIDPQASLSHELLISGMVVGGQLRMQVVFSPQRIQESTIATLLALFQQETEQVLKHCLQQDTIQMTPSDLSYKELDLDEMDDILEDIGL